MRNAIPWWYDIAILQSFPQSSSFTLDGCSMRVLVHCCTSTCTSLLFRESGAIEVLEPFRHRPVDKRQLCASSRGRAEAKSVRSSCSQARKHLLHSTLPSIMPLPKKKGAANPSSRSDRDTTSAADSRPLVFVQVLPRFQVQHVPSQSRDRGTPPGLAWGASASTTGVLSTPFSGCIALLAVGSAGCSTPSRRRQ